MRFLLINHIQNARQSLRSSRLRSLLTMLGVTIGVASITTILALSGGASKIVSDQVNSLGGNIAVIRPGTTSNTLSSITEIQPRRDFSTSTLTTTDLTYIKVVPHVAAVAPLMIMSGTIKADSVAPSNSPIVATTPDLATISHLKVSAGQFLDPTIDPNTVVIGSQLSVNTFGTESSIGKILTIRGKPFTVIGVLQTLGDPVNYNSVDFDNAAIINFASGQQLNQGVAQIQQINIQADSVNNLDQAIINLNKVLLATHLGEADFSILSGSQISQPTSQLYLTIAGVSAAIAGISLLVGGIGIMNIMLVTVAERTREIGIRKALGASNGDIAWQFLIESLAISVVGGAIGYILGYAAAFAISTTFLTFNPIVTWQIAATAVGISLVMGIIFGLYPAFRASSKEPIESLRQFN